MIIIDKNKCIGCSLCVKDCVAFDLKVKNGKAVAANKSCIQCGHCEAICPKGAITITGFHDKTIEMEQVRLNPKEYLESIQTRRTVRQFTSQSIPQEVIDMILEAGRLAPTGGNGQGTSYIILDQKKEVCEQIAVQMFRKGINLGKRLIAFLSNMEIDDHFFFKKAPLVILIMGKDKVSASLAAQNMATMAEANGLGVLFSGFFTTSVNLSKKIKKELGISRKEKAVTTLVIGYPAVKYNRTVHRKDIKVRVC
ncbi:MAG: nitroreductase family protein [Firmicutes bacterium]|nr:nitroreductase family protein [Bacillota bacterium]